MDIHNITAIALLIMGGFVARAYIPTLRSRMTPPATALTWGFFFFSLGSVGRSAYWSLGRVLMGDHWLTLRDALGGLTINVAFDAFLILGFYCALRARLLALPEEDRRTRNIFTCVTYPEPFRLSVLWRVKERDEP